MFQAKISFHGLMRKARETLKAIRVFPSILLAILFLVKWRELERKRTSKKCLERPGLPIRHVCVCVCVESWILFGLEIVNIVGPGMNKLQIS